MARIFYVHWHEAEAKTHARALRRGRSQGRSPLEHGGAPEDREPDPHALVISLDRLPSRGRHVAEWFWKAKKRRSHPGLLLEGRAPLVLGRLRKAKR